MDNANRRPNRRQPIVRARACTIEGIFAICHRRRSVFRLDDDEVQRPGRSDGRARSLRFPCPFLSRAQSDSQSAAPRRLIRAIEDEQVSQSFADFGQLFAGPVDLRVELVEDRGLPFWETLDARSKSMCFAIVMDTRFHAVFVDEPAVAVMALV